MKTATVIIVTAGLALLFVIFILLHVFSYHSPTIDILGSYFPAWMICIVSGLTFTLVARWIIQAANATPYFGPAPLINSCLMIIFTFATWIVFYQN